MTPAPSSVHRSPAGDAGSPQERPGSRPLLRLGRACVPVLVLLVAVPASASAATDVTIVANDDVRANVSPSALEDGVLSAAEPPAGNAFLEARFVDGFVGNLRIEATSIVTVAAPIDKAVGDLSLSAPSIRLRGPVALGDGAALFQGPIDGDAAVSVRVPASRSVVFGGPIGRVAPPSALSVSGQVQLPAAVTTSGAQDYAGDADAPAGARLTAGGGLTLRGLTADGSVDVTAGGAVAAGALRATGSVSVSSVRGNVTVPAAGGSGLSLTAAAGDVTLGSPTPTSANALDVPDAEVHVQAQRDVTVGLAGDHAYAGLSAPGVLTLATTGNLTLAGRTAAGTRLDLRSGGDVENTGTLEAPTVAGSAAGRADLGAGQPAAGAHGSSIGPFRSSSLVARFAGDLATGGDLIGGDTLDLAASGELHLAHAVDATTLLLRGGAGIRQTSGALRAEAAELRASGGVVAATSVANDVARVEARAGGGAVGVRTRGDVELAGVEAMGAIDARAGGALRLTAPAKGTDVVLAAGGAFVNDPACRVTSRRAAPCPADGAGAIDASGRWLVYAATSDGSTFGGLDSGTAPLWNATPDSAAPAAIAGTRYVFGERPVVTLTPRDRTTLVGTDATDEIAAVPVDVHGARPAVTGAYRAGAPFVGTPVPRSAGAAPDRPAGSYPITVTGATASDGYLLRTATGTHTVAPCDAVPGGCPATPAVPGVAPVTPAPAVIPAAPKAVAPCVSRRRVVLHARLPRGARRVVATVGGRRVGVHRTSGRLVRLTADLRGRPAGRYRVRLVVSLANGRSVVVRSTVLRTCLRRSAG